jgi:succinyl-CoA synthetase alpha subunit
MSASFRRRLTSRLGARLSAERGRSHKPLVMEDCGVGTTRNPAEMGKLLKSVL